MKVLVVGASGGIGSQALTQSLSRPQITKVVAFSRRPLSIQHPKLENILIEDFSKWPEDVLRENSDAAGMIWCMGSYSGSETVDFEFPVAFMNQMVEVLGEKPRKTPFKYVHLSGKFVREDQSLNLCWGNVPRKLKGRSDTAALQTAERHPDVWLTRVVKPGGVANKGWMSPGVTLFGDNWAVRGEELGAFMTYLVVDGQGESPVSENARIARKGRELLLEPRG